MCWFDCFKNNTNTNTNGRMNTIQIASNRSVVTREPTPYPGRHKKFIINENINSPTGSVRTEVGVQVSNAFPDAGQTTPTTESIDFLDSTSSLGGAANMSNFSFVLPYQQTWV